MIAKEHGVGNNPIIIMIMVGGMGVFHSTTLEEYYLGTLVLPILNPVSDGSALICCALIFTGSIGNEFWSIEACDGTWLRIPNLPTLNRGQIGALVIFGLCVVGIFLK